jgi:hypothetical protein
MKCNTRASSTQTCRCLWLLQLIIDGYQMLNILRGRLRMKLRLLIVQRLSVGVALGRVLGQR